MEASDRVQSRLLSLQPRLKVNPPKIPQNQRQKPNPNKYKHQVKLTPSQRSRPWLKHHRSHSNQHRPPQTGLSTCSSHGEPNQEEGERWNDQASVDPAYAGL